MRKTKLNQDTSKILERIDKAVKVLQYQLSRIITTQADYHIKLLPNKWINVELIE